MTSPTSSPWRPEPIHDNLPDRLRYIAAQNNEATLCHPSLLTGAAEHIERLESLLRDLADQMQADSDHADRLVQRDRDEYDQFHTGVYYVVDSQRDFIAEWAPDNGSRSTP